jgi:Fe-S-cluster-containing hydrogenase component 2
MKKLAVTDKSLCMTCRTCELACAGAFYKNDDIRLSCIRIGEKDGKSAIALCVQCGKCAKARLRQILMIKEQEPSQEKAAS